MQMQEPAYKAVEVIAFLRMLLRKIPGDLLIIWDGSPIHRADVVKAFLTSPQGKRVHLEPLPGSAPELNPQEQVWNLLKCRELKNLCCQDLAHLRRELVLAKERLRHRQTILQHCFTHALAEVWLSLTRSIKQEKVLSRWGWRNDTRGRMDWRRVLIQTIKGEAAREKS